jgi:hypothetical protein
VKRSQQPVDALEHGAVPWLLAGALATAGPHASHLPAWLSLLVAGAMIWRAGLWWQHRPLPARWLLGLLVIGGVAAIAWQFHSLLGKDAGVAMLVLLMALKPLEMRSRRDAQVIVMLGFFLLLTHYFYSQSIPTGLWLLAAMTLLTGALIRLHGGAQPVTTIARQAALLLLQALPFLLILYLLFPRVSGPLWGLPQDAYSGLSGLSEQMSPGSISNLIQSGAIALRSRFAGEVPEKAELYWRGPVFDAYDGSTWRGRGSRSLRRSGAGDRGQGSAAGLHEHRRSAQPALAAGARRADQPAARQFAGAHPRSPGARTAARACALFLQSRRSTTAPTASKQQPRSARRR